MKPQLEQILEELLLTYNGIMVTEEFNKHIAQAKSKIEEIFGEWVPSEKKDDYRGEFMIDTVERLFAFHRGWNACCEEIRNRVKEGR